MAYQNNNNRVVPNDVQNIELKPVASPTNQLIQYQPDITKEKELAGTFDGLAKLGQGVVDMDFLLKRKAEESILAAEAQTQAQGQNQMDWTAVSKNVKGMAKFNPYIKDAYRGFTAKNIENMAKVKMLSQPNILSGKWDSQQVNKYLQDTTQELMTAFQQTGLRPRDYETYLEDYYSSMYKLKEHYANKNAEYTYNNSKTAMAHDGAIQLFSTIIDNKNKPVAEQIIANKTTINNIIKGAEAVGIPADEIGKDVIGVMLSEFCMQNPDLVNTEQLTAMLSDIKVYGKDINEIIPNYQYQLHQILVQAREAQYQDRAYELKFKELNLKIGQMNANKDLYNFMMQNPNATAGQVSEFIKGTITKYKLEENGLEILSGGLATQNKINDLMLNISNPDVVTHLSTLATMGDLTSGEINSALKNGTLGLKDAMSLTQLMNTKFNKDVTSFNKVHNQVTSMLKNKQYGTTLTNQDIQNLQLRADEIQSKLNKGEITVDEAIEKINAVHQRAINIAKVKRQKASADLLINGSYLKAQAIPSFSLTNEKKAFKQLGYVRNSNGSASDNITSVYNSPRGKGFHKGVDVTGTDIRNTHATGKVVSAGYLSDLGNYVIIQYANGNMVRIGHMANKTSDLKGFTLAPNSYIGKVGNTGSASRGAHADFRFMNKNGILINSETFRKGLF